MCWSSRSLRCRRRRVGLVAGRSRRLLGDGGRGTGHCRRASTAATAMPISTATIRSNATVAPAVTHEDDRVAAGGAQHRAHVVRRRPCAPPSPSARPPARRAGSRATRRRRGTARPATSTTAWTIAATRVRAPARTLTAVRAIAPVAGMPPNSGDDDVGEPLAEELAVGIVARRVGHAVGDLRRQQALDRREQRRPRAPGRAARCIVELRRRAAIGAGSESGQRADARRRRGRTQLGDDRRGDDRERATRAATDAQRGSDDHDAPPRAATTARRARAIAGAGRARDAPHGGDRRVFSPVGLGARRARRAPAAGR